MTQWILGALALLLLASPAFAEFNGKAEYQEMILQNAAVATGNGSVIPVDRYSSIALDVSIVTTATVTFEGSVDGTSVSTVTCVNTSTGVSAQTATATAMYQCNVAGLRSFRARVSAWTAGAVTVFARASTAVLGSGGGGGSGGAGSSTPTLAGCWATAAQPTYLEGTLNALSCTLGGLVRMTMETLLSGEDQTNNLLMVSGGATRLTTFSSVTSATSSTVTTVFNGPKTFVAQITNGTSETKAATLTIYGNWTNSTTGAFPVCTITLPSTVTVTHLEGNCPDVKQNYMYWFYTASVYTSASAAPLTVYAMN